MLMLEKESGDLIQIEQVDDLMNPFNESVDGRRQAGEEEQDRETFSKPGLTFPSGEPLPECWTNPEYQTKSREPSSRT